MAKASAVREAKKAERTPFSSPSDDETVEILIPEGAESGRIPAGDQYIGKCLGFVREESKSSGNPMLTWTFTMHEGDFTGMDFTLWTPLTENSMWKLADVLTALGVEWEPGVPLNIRSKDLQGILVRMNIVDDKYEGRERSKLKGILPHPDGAGKKAKKGFTVPSRADDDDEDEEVSTRALAKKGRKIREEEEEDEEDERPVRSRKRAPVEDEDEEDERPRRGKRTPDMDDMWPAKKSGRKVRDEDEEEEDERPARRGRKVVDEDEDEEEDEPVRKKSAKRSRL